MKNETHIRTARPLAFLLLAAIVAALASLSFYPDSATYVRTDRNLRDFGNTGVDRNVHGDEHGGTQLDGGDRCGRVRALGLGRRHRLATPG